MAATISVNFANEQEVYDESRDSIQSRSKKSVSAKLLQDVLGGGVVSGGYVKRTGDTMTGYLTLTSLPPTKDYHAASKFYVDTHSYTRRYYYECRDSSGYGFIPSGAVTISGLDLYTNPLFFFERRDSSLQGIKKYLDVFRDGILQVMGQDYNIISTTGSTFLPGITAIKFVQPFETGSTVQVNIGNTGAFPLTFGVSFLSGTYGVRTTGISGDLYAYVEPTDFAAKKEEVAMPVRNDVYVSPNNLSAFPMLPRAHGLFRKDITYNTDFSPKNPQDPYGNLAGNFELITSQKLNQVKSDPDNSNTPGLFRAIFSEGVIETLNYNASISVNLEKGNSDFASFASVLSDTRKLSSFDFIIYDVFGSDPLDIYEISIQVY